jgi:hypothetical protein
MINPNYCDECDRIVDRPCTTLNCPISKDTNIINFPTHNSVKDFLNEVLAASDQIESIVIVSFNKDGVTEFGHANCKRRDMAFASIVLAQNCLE